MDVPGVEKKRQAGKKLAPVLLSYLLTAVVILLDQATKLLAVRYIKPRTTLPLIDGVLHFTYVENTGAAFGMMKNSRWVFMVVSTAAIIALFVLIWKYAREDAFTAVTISIILGGGVGNMIDRVRLGYVVDFIDFRLINFAVFNVADSFVTVGSCLLIVLLIREIVKERRAGIVSGATPEDASESHDSDVDGDADSCPDSEAESCAENRAESRAEDASDPDTDEAKDETEDTGA